MCISALGVTGALEYLLGKLETAAERSQNGRWGAAGGLFWIPNLVPKYPDLQTG